MPMLIDNMLLHGIHISNLPECYDIQCIFSREIMRGETRYSLDTAHDALHDAQSTAKICNHLELVPVHRGICPQSICREAKRQEI